MTHAIIEDKSGRRAIRARYFVDATGDADVLARIGLRVRKDDALQPPTMCALLAGLDAVRQAGVRAIVQGWEEAISILDLPDTVYL